MFFWLLHYLDLDERERSGREKRESRGDEEEKENVFLAASLQLDLDERERSGRERRERVEGGEGKCFSGCFITWTWPVLQLPRSRAVSVHGDF